MLAAGSLSASHAEATSKLAGRMLVGRVLQRVKRGSRLVVSTEFRCKKLHV
jgi:hypothetical protein